MKKKIVKKPKPKIGRSVKGQFLPGFCPNPKGGPKLGEAKLDRLMEAVGRVESKHNLSILDHFVERAFKKDIVLIALMKKLVPDLKSVEVVGSLGQGEMTPEEAAQIQEVFRERFNRILKNHAQLPSK